MSERAVRSRLWRRFARRGLSAGLVLAAAGGLLGALIAVPPQAEAAPLPNRAEVTVKAVSDRTGPGAADVSPLAGVTFSIIPGRQNQQPTSYAGEIATATSDATGNAVHSDLPPLTGTSSGSPRGYWLIPKSAPAGYRIIEGEWLGQFDGSNPQPLFRYGLFTGNVGANQSVGVTQLGTYWQNAGFMPSIRDNPAISNAVCQAGLDMIITVDLSYSTANNITAYKASIKSFIDSMAGTFGTLRIATFAGTAPAYNGATTQPYSLTDPAGIAALKTRVDQLNYVFTNDYRQGTNWDAAFSDLDQYKASTDLVIFLTDGMPTLDQPMLSDMGRVKIRNQDYAVTSANRLKAAGIRIVAAGVGDAGSNPQHGWNLSGVSGPTLGSDYFQTSWTQLGTQLSQSIRANCTPGYGFAKASDPVSGSEVQPGDTIAYTVTGSNTGGTALNVAISDSLSDVLQHADYNGDAVAKVNGQTVAAPTYNPATKTLSWSGPVPAGQSVTLEYTVTVHADAWGVQFKNHATSTATPPTGPPITPPPGETEHHTPSRLTFWKTSTPPSGSEVSAGDEITYTLHFKTEGGVPHAVDHEDVVVKVIDDADIVAGPTPSNPALAVTPVVNGRFAITGSVPGDTEYTVSYTVRVKADGQRGDSRLDNHLVPTGTIPPEECVPVAGEPPTCTTHRVLGSVVWQKTDAQGDRLGGSEWELVGPAGPGSQTDPVADCDEASAVDCTGPDRDPRPGFFLVEDLAWGDYTLVETQAPLGYVLDPTPHPFTIGGTAPQQRVDLGSIVNERPAALIIPLTGGLGADWFLFGGGGILAALLALMAARAHRRKRALVGPDPS